MPRRFSEEEAKRIFARVAERQRATAHADDGLSIEDLEEAARAAGLDPRLIAHAAAELDTPTPSRTMLGAPIEVTTSRLIEAPLDEDTWVQIVNAARAQLGQTGIAGQVGRLREWTLISGGTKNNVVTRLSAEPAGDGTRITVTQSARDVVFGFSLAGGIQAAMALMFGTLAAFGVDPELWIPFGILLGLGTAMFSGVQIGSRIWHRRRTRSFETLLDRIELAAARAAPERSTSSPQRNEPTADEPRGQLDLDALDEFEPSSTPDRRRLRH